MHLPRFTFATLRAVALGLAIGVLGGAPPAAALTIAVDPDDPGARIPSRLTGLSFEVDTLRAPWLDPALGNTARLVRGLDPPSLRFSANAVERQFWTRDPSEPRPAWAKGILTPAELARGGAFTEDVDAAMDLGVNFGQFDPQRAADQARAAVATIGPTLRSLQIGNEPDLYRIFGDTDRRFYVYSTYKRDERAYRAALSAAAPGVPIAGPDASGGPLDNQGWIAWARARQVNGFLAPYARTYGGIAPYLNAHLYPLTSCFSAPPRGQLLSQGLQRSTADYLARIRSIARRAGMALHLSETNSTSCGGQGADSFSFASALWIVQYTLMAAQIGVAELNFHTTMACKGYSVICFPDAAAAAAGQARAQPAYYGLMLVRHLLGSRFLRVTRSDDRGHVPAYAAVAPDGTVRVVLVNMTGRSAGDVRIRLGRSSGDAVIQRLTAPSMDSQSGIRFAGATVQPDGGFTPGPGTVAPVTGDGGITVDLPAASAALVTVAPTGGP